MRFKLAFAAAGLAALFLAASADAQGPTVIVEDFEGEFPGVNPVWGNGFDFFGGGAEPAFVPVVTREVIETGGPPENLQAFRITIDASNQAGTWGWYYGLGTFLVFRNEGSGVGGGQPGEDNPANYTVSFDLKTSGNTSGTPLAGQVVIYKPDYETVYQVDLDGDGIQADDGIDTWQSDFALPTVADNYANFNHVVWNLGAGSAPTLPQYNGGPSPLAAPIFDDESTFVLRLTTNNGGWGIDDGNSFTIDNVALTFTPPGSTPGDFDGNTLVDGNDFLKWQRGELAPPVDAGDLAEWRDAFPDGGVTAIPEPAAGAIAIGGLAGMALARRRRQG
jgi:hypothetical protein